MTTPSEMLLFEKGAKALANAGEGWSKPAHHGTGYARIFHAASGYAVQGNPSCMYCVVKGDRTVAQDMKAPDAIAVALKHIAADADAKVKGAKPAPAAKPAELPRVINPVRGK